VKHLTASFTIYRCALLTANSLTKTCIIDFTDYFSTATDASFGTLTNERTFFTFITSFRL